MRANVLSPYSRAAPLPVRAAGAQVKRTDRYATEAWLERMLPNDSSSSGGSGSARGSSDGGADGAEA
jgi:hypothetical protein